MKLSELNLKTKPQTKYFDGGYVSFAVRNGELYFSVSLVKRTDFPLSDGNVITSKQLDKLYSNGKMVKSKEHLQELLSVNEWVCS